MDNIERRVLKPDQLIAQRFRVLQLIGSGGMGEVYKARDEVLHRPVAIKVLRHGFASSPECRQRFEREARSLSLLTHPRICALYDVGTDGNLTYLVMEFVVGESLSARIRRSRLRMDETLRIGAEIAEALECAHNNGIIHRDLKPANVMLTDTGVKLLDFGIAKWTASETGPTAAETLITTRGQIIGTFAYMSPEQTLGELIDVRSDIFSLGSILYEVLGGKPAFAGKNPQDVVAATQAHDPPSLVGVPQHIDNVVRTCLAKDPNDRWQTAREVKRELLRPRDAPSLPTKRRHWILTAGLLLVLLAVGVVIFIIPPKLSLSEPVLRFTFDLPASARRVTLSNDGRWVAYTTNTGLTLRRLDSDKIVEVPGTSGADPPFWSPDGRFIAFGHQGKLKRMDVYNNALSVICEAPGFSGKGSWSTDGTILLDHDGLKWVPASGGTLAEALPPDRGKASYSEPLFLSNGRTYLFTHRLGGAVSIHAGELGSSDTRKILDGQRASYVPPRHGRPAYLVYVHGNELMVQEFDPIRLQLRGTPTRLLQAERVPTAPDIGITYSVSHTGVLVRLITSSDTIRLKWFDRSGKPDEAFGEQAAYNLPMLSPDERTLVVEKILTNAGTDLWLVDLQRRVFSRFTSGPQRDCSPIWAPDGRSIVYSSHDARTSQCRFVRRFLDRSSEDQVLWEGQPSFISDWSRDGQWLVFNTMERGSDLRILPTNSSPGHGTARSLPWMNTEFNETSAVFSPDGKWIAYRSDESGRYEIYVSPFTPHRRDGRGKTVVSNAGGYQPRWRIDGRELYFLSEDKMMSVAFTPGDPPRIGAPVPLFKASPPIYTSNPFAVTGDGKRFLIVDRVPATKGELEVLVNWDTELGK
jgi:serine/threonine protein kinase